MSEEEQSSKGLTNEVTAAATPSKPSEYNKGWAVYVLCSLDPAYPNNTYVGISNDVKKRERSHNGGKSGAYATCLRRPWQAIVFVSGFESSKDVLNAERTMKTINRKNKGAQFTGPAGRIRSILYCLTKLERWTPSYPYEMKE
jgi:predicted GIY-YIG superfamily endonuclease